MNLLKGKQNGSKVSHAKNRLARIFSPNNQSLKVWSNGKLIRIGMSTSMIQRLKKDGRVGQYRVYKPFMNEKGNSQAKKQSPADVAKIVETEMAKVRKTTKSMSKSKKAQETMDISSIVGKK